MKGIFKLGLIAVALCAGLQLAQFVSISVNTDKIKESIDNINSSTSSDEAPKEEIKEDNTNISTYSNLIIQEEAPADTSAIWIKSNETVKDIEYSNNTTLNYSNNYTFEKLLDLSTDTNINFEYGYNTAFNNNTVYNVEYIDNSINLISYDGITKLNTNIASDVVGSNYLNIYYNRFENKIYISNLYNNHMYIYVYDFTSNIKTYDLYNSALTIYSSNYNLIGYNNTIYLFSYNSTDKEYLGNLEDQSIELASTDIKVYSNSKSHTYFNVNYENENEIILKTIEGSTSNGYYANYKINKLTNEITKIFKNGLSSNNTSKNDYFVIFNDGFIYEYKYVSTSHYVNDSLITNYVLQEKIYDENTTQLISTNNYDIEDLTSSDFECMYYYLVNDNNELEVYLNCYNGSKNKGIYKLTKGSIKNESNQLLIIDSEANKTINLNPYVIKFNDMFSYKLYAPKFYITDNEGQAKQVYAYKFNEAVQAWELI